jgi:hypothetical protein
MGSLNSGPVRRRLWEALEAVRMLPAFRSGSNSARAPHKKKRTRVPAASIGKVANRLLHVDTVQGMAVAEEFAHLA